MSRLTMNEAIVAGLRDEFVANPKVFCLGQDIGMMGGPLQSFHGLWDEFKKPDVSLTRRSPKKPCWQPAWGPRCAACALSLKLCLANF